MLAAALLKQEKGERSMKKKTYSSPTELDGRLPLIEAIPLGLQHVLAMFVGNLSPLLAIMAICGITTDEAWARSVFLCCKTRC